MIVPITEYDQWYLDTWAGSHLGQQVWEALIILIALRHWAWVWRHKRVSLTIKTDNMTALTMVSALKSSGPALGNIARGMALDLAHSESAPDMVRHTPGVMNKTPDTLSRFFDPSFKFVFPPVLKDAIQVYLAQRDGSWWLASSPPSV